MNNDEIRKLIQQSIMKTSDTFTDDLMRKVELQRNAEREIRTGFSMACFTCIALLLLVSRLSLDIELIRFQLSIPAMIIRVFGSLVIFVLLHRLIVLRSELLRAR